MRIVSSPDQDEEELVRLRMAVSGELTEDPYDSDVVVVDDGDRPRRPVFGQRRQDVVDVASREACPWINTGDVTNGSEASWPPLPTEDWKPTLDTLHLWTQIVGKVRMAHTPLMNHWWNVTLYVTPIGLTTSSIPYGRRSFQIDFDFNRHELVITTSAGDRRTVALMARSVADFYTDVMRNLDELGLTTTIWTVPVEIPGVVVPFEADHEHASYDAEAVHRWWQVLVQIDRVFQVFRARYLGKVSPVHFFWGGFDLAVTRFSGRAGATVPAQRPPLWRRS